jgi:hypothetical protein
VAVVMVIAVIVLIIVVVVVVIVVAAAAAEGVIYIFVQNLFEAMRELRDALDTAHNRCKNLGSLGSAVQIDNIKVQRAPNGAVRTEALQIQLLLDPNLENVTLKEKHYQCYVTFLKYAYFVRLKYSYIPFVTPTVETPRRIIQHSYLICLFNDAGRLCGLVVRVIDYRCRGPGFDSRALQKK